MKCIHFIVNANEKIGFGHLKRCLLLARIFPKKDYEIQFLVYDTNPYFLQEINKNFKYLQFKNKEECLQSITKNDCDFLIIDTDDDYFYLKENQLFLKEREIKFMHFSIKNKFHYYSDIFLNQNVMALDTQYSHESYTKLLLGPRYFVLDDDFKNIKPNPRLKENNLFICFGSTDPSGITLKLLDLGETFINDYDKIIVVVGGANESKEKIFNHFLVKKNPSKLELHFNTKSIYELMQRSTKAFTSMGMTFWELILHGIPSFVISGTHREKSQIQFFCDKAYSYYIGNFDDENFENKWIENYKRSNFNSNNIFKLNKLIDVNGKQKVVNTIINLLENS